MNKFFNGDNKFFNGDNKSYRSAESLDIKKYFQFIKFLNKLRMYRQIVKVKVVKVKVKQGQYYKNVPKDLNNVLKDLNEYNYDENEYIALTLQTYNDTQTQQNNL